ncbi:MAG: DUF1127 domain-containing protein [Proteobacteria bacterium]|nr:MAG: DUF1127 domain-containing protein [Pseudomonadota bacterium]TDJ69939.1 MAG: DUF1127 domain-containing protein [Pseudomonadota bacterium]
MNTTTCKANEVVSVEFALVGLGGVARNWIQNGVVTAFGWWDRARQRHHLLQLDDRLLKDVGLTRAGVEREAAKPFWQC